MYDVCMNILEFQTQYAVINDDFAEKERTRENVKALATELEVLVEQVGISFVGDSNLARDLANLKLEEANDTVYGENLQYVTSLDTSIAGWDCDLRTWVFKTDKGVFCLATNHGFAYVATKEEVLKSLEEELESAKDRLNSALAVL